MTRYIAQFRSMEKGLDGGVRSAGRGGVGGSREALWGKALESGAGSIDQFGRIYVKYW